MGTNQTMRTITLKASADLSSDQFKLVKWATGAKVALVADPADIPLGVLQNKPAADGDRAIIALLDGAVLKMKAGAAITAGVQVTVHDTADGKIDDAGIGAGDHSVGIALEAATATDDVIEVATHLMESHA